jgi:hypothetical protein
MTPKMVFGVACAAALTWYFNAHRETTFSMPAPAAERSGKPMVSQDFVPLFEAEAPLSSLAGDGVYTVVEVYINTCSICKQLERDLPPFLAARNDVVVMRVHYPERGISWPLGDALGMEQRMNSYNICGTPHIEIYGPDGKALAVDDCGNKDALRFLRSWMASERASG